MRRYREMRAAEKERKRQKHLAAIRAVIKKRQDQMLIDDVLNKSHEVQRENDFSEDEDRDMRAPTDETPHGLKTNM